MLTVPFSQNGGPTADSGVLSAARAARQRNVNPTDEVPGCFTVLESDEAGQPRINIKYTLTTHAKMGGFDPSSGINRHQGANRATLIAFPESSLVRHPALPSLPAAEKNQRDRNWIPLERSPQHLRGAPKREAPASGEEDRPVISRI